MILRTALRRLGLMLFEASALTAVLVLAAGIGARTRPMLDGLARHRVELAALEGFNHAGFDFPLGGGVTSDVIHRSGSPTNDAPIVIAVVDASVGAMDTLRHLQGSIRTLRHRPRLEIYPVGPFQSETLAQDMADQFSEVVSDLFVGLAPDAAEFAQFTGIGASTAIFVLGDNRTLRRAVFGPGRQDDVAWLFESSARATTFRVGTGVGGAR